jgi:hypothetical protein
MKKINFVIVLILSCNALSAHIPDNIKANIALIGSIFIRIINACLESWLVFCTIHLSYREAPFVIRIIPGY